MSLFYIVTAGHQIEKVTSLFVNKVCKKKGSVGSTTESGLHTGAATRGAGESSVHL